MNKPHKWAKEIRAWADGAEIEQADIRENANPHWYEADNPPKWDTTFYKYRIKPQPKEPQYLYVYQCKSDGKYEFTSSMIYGYPKNYIGKIKLEQDDE